MPTFVIQEHKSKNLHYDFRLELGGALKSWAVPKIPLMAKGMKRLAIQVEDHAKSYANFQGEIKEGYGKGIVKIWDNGNFSLEKRTPKEIIFNLQGKRLKGRYALIKTNFGSQPEKTWLLTKLG